LAFFSNSSLIIIIIIIIIIIRITLNNNNIILITIITIIRVGSAILVFDMGYLQILIIVVSVPREFSIMAIKRILIIIKQQ